MNAKKIEKLEAKIAQAEKDIIRMQELDVTDCSLSLHATRMGIRLMETQIQILKNDGYANFPVLTDLDGNVVSERIVNGRYGQCFIIENADGTVKFVNHNVKAKTLEKKGYKLADKAFKAWAVIDDMNITTFKTDEGGE